MYPVFSYPVFYWCLSCACRDRLSVSSCAPRGPTPWTHSWVAWCAASTCPPSPSESEWSSHQTSCLKGGHETRYITLSELWTFNRIYYYCNIFNIHVSSDLSFALNMEKICLNFLTLKCFFLFCKNIRDEDNKCQ